MIKQIKYYTVIFCLLGCMSCEDFFSTTLEIDPPVHEELLAIHAFGDTRSNELTVLVSDSHGILESPPLFEDRIDDAVVKLFLEEELIYELENSGGLGSNFIMGQGIHEFQKGNNYRLEVTAPGYPKATAYAKVPLDIPIESIAFEEDAGSDFDGESSSGVNIRFQDKAENEDYYEVVCATKDFSPGGEFFRHLYTDSFDPITVYADLNLMYSDETFNGKEKTIELLIDQTQNPDEIDLLYANWRIISKDHFLFNKSLVSFYDADGNPFASPVQIYSSFEEAIGIFSIVNDTMIKVQ